MVYDILGKGVPLSQNQQFLVACSLSDYGSQNRKLSHCQCHNANRGVPHRLSYDALQAEQYSHSHSLLHTSGKCSYPFQGQSLQRLGIQAIGIPLLVVELNRPSNSGAYHQSKYAEVVEVSSLISKRSLVAFALWLQTTFYLLKRQLSSFWFLPYRVVSYLYYIIHRELVQWSD